MSVPTSVRIELCGRFVVDLGGRRVERELPGRQGRLLLAYLATRRGRPMSRDELIAALWPADLPADPEKSLGALLSKVRRAVPSGLIEGRGQVELVLPPDGSIDLEDAREAAARAEAALADADWRTAWAQAGAAVGVVSRGFLAGYEAPWIQEHRRDVEELRLRALEAAAAAGSALGGPELAGAERAGRALIEAAPFRESGYRLLMVALAAHGNVAEALQVYEQVRVRLRDELGAAPGAALQALHERLLRHGAGGPGGAPLVDPMAAPDEVEPPPGVREERRLVSVLFADLSAGRGLDPESAEAMLAPHRARIRVELERFGGTIDRFVGGALLAVFGAPVAHEDDPERAVRAALAVVELVGALGREAPELEPVARAGIATGEALVRLGRAPADGDALVQGDVVGAALRLLGSATANSVIVDHATFLRTGDAVEYRELEPLRSWAAHGIRATAAPAPTRFVGREHELALLDALQRTVAEEARPRLVAIVGEPGVGKTRLTDELIGCIAGDVNVYRGRCLPYGEGVTYWALREILWAAAGIRLDDDRDAAAGKLGRLVGRLLEEPGDAQRTAAALAQTAGMAVADSPLERMSPESMAEEIGLAWPRFLGALASDRATVVVVEDLHWAEAPLLDMLERLVRRATGRLLIVATARPEFAEARPRWSATPGMTQIGLEPLTDAQSRELVQSLLPGAGDDLVARVVDPAEGNPFFAEELARQLAANIATEAVPHSVRALLAARIDALPEAEKRVLHDAAVVGRVFWATALEAMAAGAPVRASLQSLEAKGLIVANPDSVLPGQPEYSFRHALKREVAYRSIPRAQRGPAHAAVAGWIEHVAGDRRAEFAELIAYHYETAAAPLDAALAWPDDLAERERVRSAAVRALVTAGDQARARLALDQALRFADRALELAAGDAERLATLELRASALHAAVRCDEAFGAYRTGLELAQRLGDTGAYSRLRADAVLLCARFTGAFTDDSWKRPAAELIERGLAELGADQATFEVGALLIGRSAMSAGWFDAPTGHEPSTERDARRAIEIAEALDSPYLLSRAVESLLAHVLGGALCGAGELAERLVAVSESLSDRAEVHEGLITAAITLARAGRHERALEVARRASRDSERLSPHQSIHAAAAEVMCLLPAGRFDELLRVTTHVPSVVRDEGGRLCQVGALALAGRALALFERGERDAAQDALALLEAAPPPGGIATLRPLALEIVRPLAGLERTRRRAAELGPVASRAAQLYALRLDLQLSALAADWGALDGLVADARELASSGCAPTLGWIADWAEAVALAAAGDGADAVRRATSAAGALTEYGEPYIADRLLVDLLPFLDADLREPLGRDIRKRLAAMGASASAAEPQRHPHEPTS